MTTLAVMRQRIADELTWGAAGPDGIPARVIDDEIRTAVAHYESDRFRWNEVHNRIVATLTASIRTYTLSSSWIRLDSLKQEYNDSYIVLERRTWETIETSDRQISGNQGIPYSYVYHSNLLRVYPVPSVTTTLLGSGLIRLSELSLGSSTNGWTTFGEELIRSRAKAALEVNYFGKQIHPAVLDGREFLSPVEAKAFGRLRDETFDMIAVNRTKPYFV